MRFKKGQIVPRWIGVKAKDRKAQHCIKFGGDASYENGKLFLESDGAVMCISGIRRVMKNGTTKKSPVDIKELYIDCSRVNHSTAIQFK